MPAPRPRPPAHCSPGSSAPHPSRLRPRAIRPWAENSPAIALETSSSAAATSPVVEPAAAACAARSDEPILATSAAAPASVFGAAINNDIGAALLYIPCVRAMRQPY